MWKMRHHPHKSIVLFLLLVNIVAGEADTNNIEIESNPDAFKHSDSFKLEEGEKEQLILAADSEPAAAFRLYLFYMITAHDYQNAVRWLGKAANGGHVVAMYNLGYLLSDGKNSDDDIENARLWYTKAAEAGYLPAQRRLTELDQTDVEIRKNKDSLQQRPPR